MRVVERLWAGETAAGSIARSFLVPVELAYRGIIATRNALYDHGLFGLHTSEIPVLSVGNLTVGGTGKTPVSAWFAQLLAERGSKPAVILRGYGGDEPLVHEELNPGVPVIVAADRRAGIRTAASIADVAVLDDAFQHRRAARNADVVLIAAEQWSRSRRLLPAGPWREPLSSVRRATLVLITRRVAGEQQIAGIRSAVARAAPHLPVGSLRLVMGELIRVTGGGARAPLSFIRYKRILAITGIGTPGPFFSQLSAQGAELVRRSFPDHHRFSISDVERTLKDCRAVDAVVCTLKDAVKLRPLWPDEAPPLWYVSLLVEAESGMPAIDEMLTRLLGDDTPTRE